MTRISNVRKTTKFKRSIKAISPVIATLLMIAIAVVASLVVYAWVTGYIGGATTKAGAAIQIQSFAASTDGKLIVYVQNVGQGVAELKPGQSVYVNGDLVSISSGTDPITIAEGQTVELQTDAVYTGGKVDIKVTTTGGTFAQSTGTGSSNSGAGSPLPQYTLTVNSADHGAVTQNPNLAQYNSGTSVMLTAAAVDGYTFQKWSGDVQASDVNSNPVTITMDSNKVVTPNFIASPETLTVLTSGTGTGTVTANPLPPYSYGAVVQLTAAPDDSSTFGGWTGAGTTGGDPLVRTVTLNADQTATATFTIKTFTITPSAGTHGSITPNTAQTVNYGSNSPAFTITADNGYHIVDVKDGSTSLGGSGLKTFANTFTNVQASHTIAATFAVDTPTTAALTITFAGTGTGKVNDGSEDKTATFTKQYAYGSTVTLTPTADSGSTFTSWTGAGTGTTNRAIVMNGDQSATVTFNLRTQGNLIQIPGFETDSTWAETQGVGGSADRYSSSNVLSGSRCGHTTVTYPSGSNSYAILTQTLTSTPVSSIVDSSTSLTAHLRRPYTAADGTGSVELRLIAGSTTLSYMWCASGSVPSETATLKYIRIGDFTGITTSSYTSLTRNLQADWTGKGLSTSLSITSIQLVSNGYKTGSHYYGQDIAWDDMQLLYYP